MNERLRDAYYKAVWAENYRDTVLKEDYPLGGHIRWLAHGGFSYCGHVVRHSYGDRIEVCNIQTGKTRWITSYDIVGAPL